VTCKQRTVTARSISFTQLDNLSQSHFVELSFYHLSFFLSRDSLCPCYLSGASLNLQIPYQTLSRMVSSFVFYLVTERCSRGLTRQHLQFRRRHQPSVKGLHGRCKLFGYELPEKRTKGWGRIVNMSSVAAQLGGFVGPHYAASKADLIGLTPSYTALLSKEGITVNTIAPALIATEMVTRNPSTQPDLIPVRRFSTVCFFTHRMKLPIHSSVAR
jgi:hypothetical protein